MSDFKLTVRGGEEVADNIPLVSNASRTSATSPRRVRAFHANDSSSDGVASTQPPAPQAWSTERKVTVAVLSGTGDP